MRANHQRIHPQAIKGLVGGAAAGTTGDRTLWTTAFIPRSPGRCTHPSGPERVQAERAAWSAGRYKEARRALREQRRSKTGLGSLPHVKMAPMSVAGPTGERQVHLDAIVAFAGARRRRRMFEVLDVLTVNWATGRCTRRMSIHAQHAIRVLEERKRTHHKMVEVGEWIRSLTEAF